MVSENLLFVGMTVFGICYAVLGLFAKLDRTERAEKDAFDFLFYWALNRENYGPDGKWKCTLGTMCLVGGLICVALFFLGNGR